MLPPLSLLKDPHNSMPPIPIPLTFAFPCTPPNSAQLWMFIQAGEVQEGG